MLLNRNFSKTFLLVVLNVTGCLSFQPTPPPSNKFHEVDISDVLLQAQSALKAAQKAATLSQSDLEITTPKTISQDIAELSKIIEEEVQNDSCNDKQIQMVDYSKKEQSAIATAIAGSTIGVVAGSPLVLGAALGFAGSRLFEGENGKKNKEIVQKIGKSVTKQLHGAIEFAQKQVEENDGDLSKMSEKMLQTVKTRAQVLIQEDAKAIPKNIMNALKETIESEEFKQAPGLAFRSLKGLLESDELKAASGVAFNAFKESLQSEEMKALQKRASLAVKETFEKKKAN